VPCVALKLGVGEVHWPPIIGQCYRSPPHRGSSR
jgi:hypothetical protein